MPFISLKSRKISLSKGYFASEGGSCHRGFTIVLSFSTAAGRAEGDVLGFDAPEHSVQGWFFLVISLLEDSSFC